MKITDPKDFSIVDAGPASNAPSVFDPGRQKINPAVLYLLTLGTKQSRAKMRQTLNRFSRLFGYASLEDFPWERLQPVHLTTVKSQMELQGRAPATINHLLCALRGVAHQAWGEEPVEVLPGSIVNIPAGVKHWHGAAPNSWFSHLAIEVPGEGARNEWLEPVSDEDYGKLS